MAGLTLFDMDADLDGPPLCTVSELTAQIKQILEYGFAEVAVKAEVSGLSRPRSGHVYLKLKDEGASINAVLWKGDARRVVFDLTDGLAVKAWGRVAVYAPRGEYQLVIHTIEPEGIGALELAFRQMYERLKAEGLFEVDRKRPLPPYPRRIAVVTSPTGAAVHDFLRVVGRRWPGAEIFIVPTKVQGPGSAAEIAAAIELADSIAGVDFLVVTRGGGSLEDLWAFNEEAVARAIYGTVHPVVSAVGHEVDVTIADCTADLRASTPSVAGELCVPDAESIRGGLLDLRQRLERAGQGRIDDARYELESLTDRANRAMARNLERRHLTLSKLAAQLEALSPLAVLARGYSLTTPDGSGEPLRSADEAVMGSLIRTRLARGSVLSRVVAVEEAL
jgi:exodeoxyribonuclease VII large subunit